MNSTETGSIKDLPDWFCQFVDLNEIGKDCSTKNKNVCVACHIVGGFLTGERLTDYSQPGHISAILIWILTMIIGIIGIFANLLIIAVIHRMNAKRAFDFLTIILACFDMLFCVSSLFTYTSYIVLYQNWVHKGFATMVIFYASLTATLFGRTGSTYMAVLITIERFLVIYFPFRAKSWFTTWKTRFLAVCVLGIAIILNIPRFLSYQVEYNPYKNDGIASLRDFEYIVSATKFYPFFNITLDDLHSKLDTWLPLPILLVFNLLSYIRVKVIQRKRKQLIGSETKEIEALRIFLPVVFFLFITNVVPIIFFSIMVFSRTWYRELGCLIGLAIVINATVNFPIYYINGSTFKAETKICLTKWSKAITSKQGEHESNANTASTSNRFV